MSMWMRWGVVMALVMGCALLGHAQAATTPVAATTPTPTAKPAPTRPTGADFLAEGDKLVAQKLYAQALSKYLMAWLEMPENPVVAVHVGNLYTASGKDADATRFFALAIKLNPAYEEPVINLARAYLRLNRADQAAILLGDSTRQQKFVESPAFQHTWGLVNLKQAKYDPAITALKKATTLNPKGGTYFGDLGNAYYLARQYPLAVECYTQAIGLNAKDSMAYLNRSMAYEQMGRFADAVASMRQYVTMTNPSADSPARKRLADLQGKAGTPPPAN